MKTDKYLSTNGLNELCMYLSQVLQRALKGAYPSGLASKCNLYFLMI